MLDAPPPDAATPDAPPADAALPDAPPPSEPPQSEPPCAPWLPGPPLHELADGSEAFAVGDFDGDGQLDAVMWEPSAGVLGVTFGRADGTFASVATTPIPNYPRQLATGDFDRDGILDLAVLFDSGAGVLVLHGVGDGTFTLASTVPLSADGHASVVADFDRDGNLDIAISQSATDEVLVFRGLGDGTFASSTQLATGPSPVALVAVDLDLDGALDLVVSNGMDSTLSTFFGDGAGGFGAQIASPALFNGSLTAGDVTGDGVPDVVLTTDGASQVLVGDRAGGFTLGALLSPFDAACGALLADIDGDGALDLVTCGTLQVALGHGDGTFAPYTLYAIHPAAIALGDVDGDQRPDLLFALANDIGSVRNLGGGALEAPRAVYGPAQIGLYPGVADFNHDGRLDVPARGGALLDQADGSFLFGADLATGVDEGRGAVGDFDEDGSADLLIAGLSSDHFSVARGGGDGSFGAGQATALPNSVRALAIGDVDGDGHLDVVVATQAVGLIEVYRGRGDGTFGAPSAFVTPQVVNALIVVDFDGDHLDDIVALGDAHPDLRVSAGGGTFVHVGDLAFSSLAGTAADLDSDGVIDLVMLDTYRALVYRGAGAGHFAPPVAVSLGATESGGQQWVAARDLDGDGTLDLVVTDVDRVRVVLGAGGGAFRQPLVYPLSAGGGIGPTLEAPFAMLDTNGDGLLDVMATGRTHEPSRPVITAARQGPCRPPE